MYRISDEIFQVEIFIFLKPKKFTLISGDILPDQKKIILSALQNRED
jgi:hypothetical protein